MKLIRESKETKVTVSIGEKISVQTGFGFFDHMLATFANYAGMPLVIHATGDLRHHLIEDVALTVGAFVRKQIPETAARYGERVIPMDDALVQAVIDVGGRPFFAGTLPSRLYTHWFRSFATSGGMTLHLRKLRGTDRHHIIEAAFKATGLALQQAASEGGRVFSTKGTVGWTEEP